MNMITNKLNKILLKLLLRFANFLLETPLLEMASERKYQISKIKKHGIILNRHLFKYYTMSNNREDRLDIIETILCDISEYQWNYDRYYKFEEYYKWLYLDFFDNIKSEYDDIEFKNRCGIFYKTVCSDMAKNDYDPDLSERIKIFDIDAE